jgi:hypothetical protein
VSRTPDDVAVGIDENTLVLSPVGVLWWSYVRTGRAPGPSDLVSILNPDVRSAPDGPRIAVGYLAEVDLDAIARHESVPTAGVLPGCEAQPPVVRKRGRDVAHGEDRRDSLQAAHGWRIYSHNGRGAFSLEVAGAGVV